MTSITYLIIHDLFESVDRYLIADKLDSPLPILSTTV